MVLFHLCDKAHHSCILSKALIINSWNLIFNTVDYDDKLCDIITTIPQHHRSWTFFFFLVPKHLYGHIVHYNAPCNYLDEPMGTVYNNQQPCPLFSGYLRNELHTYQLNLYSTFIQRKFLGNLQPCPPNSTFL